MGSDAHRAGLWDGGLLPQTVYAHFKKLAASVGAPNAKVHDPRHTYAVLPFQNGVDVKTVQVNLGHATASFTLDVYGHMSKRLRDESAEEYKPTLTAFATPDSRCDTIRETFGKQKKGP